MRLIFFTTFIIASAHYSYSTLEGVILDKTLSIVFNTMDLIHPQESEKIKEEFLNGMLKHEKDSELLQQFRSILDLFYNNGSPVLQSKIKNVMKMLKSIEPSELREIFRSYKNSEELVGQVKKQHNSWDFAFDFLASAKEIQEKTKNNTLQATVVQFIKEEDKGKSSFHEEENELEDPLELSSDDEEEEEEKEKEEKEKEDEKEKVEVQDKNTKQFSTLFPTFSTTQEENLVETTYPKQTGILATKGSILEETLSGKTSKDYLEEVKNDETTYQSFQKKYSATTSNVIETSHTSLDKDSLLYTKVRDSSLSSYLRNSTSTYMNVSYVTGKNDGVSNIPGKEPLSSTIKTTRSPTVSSADFSTESVTKRTTNQAINKSFMKTYSTENVSDKELSTSFITVNKPMKTKGKTRAGFKYQTTTISSVESTSTKPFRKLPKKLTIVKETF
ncbi:UNVERIFIED_CONTAM: hypothetical protein RMT77_005854 [Armadillidium vulgare]